MKRCSTCKETKPREAFGKDKSKSLGLKARCKPCDVSFMRQFRQDPTAKRKRKDYDLRTKYGITIQDYDRMLVEQDNNCAICNEFEPIERNPLAVDHCHSTGKVRGLLCSNCNTAIGKFKENRDLLIAAVQYLG